MLKKNCDYPSHEKIVSEILPRFAGKSKDEGVISSYHKHSFQLLTPTSGDWPSITINPDLVIVMPDGENILVEVASPRDPKRFLGEIVYPHILAAQNQIDRAIVFLSHGKLSEHKTTIGFMQGSILHSILRSKLPVFIISWSKTENASYRNLKTFLIKQLFR